MIDQTAKEVKRQLIRVKALEGLSEGAIAHRTRLIDEVRRLDDELRAIAGELSAIVSEEHEESE